MSPQIVLLVAVLLVAVVAVVAVLRAPGAGRRHRPAPLAEPGSEGMLVTDDGEITPGAPGHTTD